MSLGGLVLVAAGGLARETIEAVRAGTPERSVVVLDDDEERQGTAIGGAEIVGGLTDIKTYDDRSVVVCAGRGAVRRQLVDRLAGLGVTSDRYATVVHPSVSVPPTCHVGAGSVLLAGVVLTADVTVGEHVVVMPHVTLTHDDVVEDYATLCAGVTLGGSVRVGEGAYLGMNASVRENLQVGAGGLLGMGSVLLRDLPALEAWAGCPARRMASHQQAGG